MSIIKRFTHNIIPQLKIISQKADMYSCNYLQVSDIEP